MFFCLCCGERFEKPAYEIDSSYLGRPDYIAVCPYCGDYCIRRTEGEKRGATAGEDARTRIERR